MVASEGTPHLGAERLTDVVAGYPAGSAVTQSRSSIRVIAFGPDDYDAAPRVRGKLLATATREIRAVDDDEIGLLRRNRGGGVTREENRLPAAVVLFEQVEDEPAHAVVADRDEDAGLPGAPAAGLSGHG